MFDWIKDLWDAIWDAIESVLSAIAEALGPLLPILIILVFVFAPYLGAWLTGMGFTGVGGALTALGTMLGGTSWLALAVGVGVSYMVAPEETAALVSDVAEFTGEVIADVTSAVATGLFSGLFDGGVPWLLLAGGGFAAWWFLIRDDGKEENSELSSVETRQLTSGSSTTIDAVIV
jgi:hypothetical protein